MKDFSYITNSHPEFIENLYRDFVKDPDSIDPEMKKFFEGFDFAIANKVVAANGGAAASKESRLAEVKQGEPALEYDWMREIRVYRLILGYRNKGHLIARTNPIRERKDRHANLDLGFFGLTEEDLDKTFQAGNLIGLGTTTLRKILEHLQLVYASHVGIEFKYISNQKKIDFLTTEMEKEFRQPLSLEKKTADTGKIEPGSDVRKVFAYQVCGAKKIFIRRRGDDYSCFGCYH